MPKSGIKRRVDGEFSAEILNPTPICHHNVSFSET